MKQPNSCIVLWQEKVKDKLVDKSFPCPKKDVEWHLNNLRKMPEVIYNPTYRNI